MSPNNEGNVRIIGCKTSGIVDANSIQKLEEISHLPHIVHPCIALPDLHFKNKMETPSSVGIGVQDHIIPHLSSTSLNCGMGAIVTELTDSKLFTNRIPDFYNEFRKRKDDKYYQLSFQDMYKVLEYGPRGVCEKYDVDPDIVKSFEMSGNALSSDYDPDDILSLIPRDILTQNVYNGRTELGTGFGGNHFLEIQRVSEIINQEVAKAHNITQLGQIVVMYHGGGGIIPGLLGAYFSRRKKGFDDGVKTNIKRYWYHLKRSSLNDFATIYDLYINNKLFIPFHENSPQGKRLVFANSCSMNYGYTYRFYMYLRIRDILINLFGCNDKGISIYSDISHNSILPEKHNGKHIWMHRHNSCRVVEGQLLVLPGYNTTSSYLSIGGDQTGFSLNTMPHGAGAVIKHMNNTGKLSVVEGNSTMIFNGMSETPDIANHLSDEGISQVVEDLASEGIAYPVVKLTPIAVLKNYV